MSKTKADTPATKEAAPVVPAAPEKKDGAIAEAVRKIGERVKLPNGLRIITR